MTKIEAATIGAYTGTLIGSFSDLHKFVETILDRPVFTHEFADKDFVAEIKRLTLPYIKLLKVT